MSSYIYHVSNPARIVVYKLEAGVWNDVRWCERRSRDAYDL